MMGLIVERLPRPLAVVLDKGLQRVNAHAQKQAASFVEYFQLWGSMVEPCSNQHCG
jgi:hypothetical protein